MWKTDDSRSAPIWTSVPPSLFWSNPDHMRVRSNSYDVCTVMSVHGDFFQHSMQFWATNLLKVGLRLSIPEPARSRSSPMLKKSDWKIIFKYPIFPPTICEYPFLLLLCALQWFLCFPWQSKTALKGTAQMWIQDFSQRWRGAGVWPERLWLPICFARIWPTCWYVLLNTMWFGATCSLPLPPRPPLLQNSGYEIQCNCHAKFGWFSQNKMP